MVILFPTLTCGVFVFSAVSAPSFLPPPSSHHPPTPTHSLTHSLTHSRGRHGTSCAASGRMYALALASLGLRRSAGGFCVAGAALAAVQGVALASLGLRCSAGGFCVAGAALGADPAAETVETWKKAAKLSFQHRTHRLFP